MQSSSKTQFLTKMLLAGTFLSTIFFSTKIQDGFHTYKLILITFFIGLTCLVIACSKLGSLSIQRNITKPFLILIGFAIAWFSYCIYLDPSFFYNLAFIYDTLLIIFFFCLLTILRIKQIRNFVITCLFSLLALTLIIGILQAVGVINPYSADFKITGTFLNPGPYSCMISLLVVIPITILSHRGRLAEPTYFLFRPSYEPLLVATVIFSVTLMVLTNIRTAYVAMIITSLVMFLNLKHAGSKYFKLKTLALFIIAIGISMGLASLSKKKSAFGRIFIWETALKEHQATNVFGNGYHNFERKYNLLQASYFIKHPDPNSEEANLAGNVGYAYNEFVEIYLNYGIIGLLGVITLMFYIAIKYYKNYKANDFGSHLSFYLLLSTLFMCCFSYPLSMPVNKLVFTAALALFFSWDPINESNIITPKYAHLIGRSLLVIFLIFALFISILHYKAYKSWYKADTALRQNRDYDLSANILKTNYHLLVSNGKYLTYYGKVLFLNHEISEAISVLEKAKEFSSDPLIYYTLGQCYTAIDNDIKAAANFNTAIAVTPNLIYPRYLYWKSRVQKNDHVQAIAIAEVILKIKEKVVSPATEDMKKAVLNYLSQHKIEKYKNNTTH